MLGETLASIRVPPFSFPECAREFGGSGAHKAEAGKIEKIQGNPLSMGV